MVIARAVTSKQAIAGSRDWERRNAVHVVVAGIYVQRARHASL